MATQEQTLNQADGWVKVIDTGTPFYAENTTAVPVKVRFSATVPSGDLNGHTLKLGDTITDVGSEDVYMKADVDGAVIIFTV